MPWPTSGFFAMMVMAPSGVMRMKAFGVKSAPVCAATAAASSALARLEVRAEQHAAAGEGGDAEEGAAIDTHAFRAVFMASSYSSRAPERDATSLAVGTTAGGAVPAAL